MSEKTYLKESGNVGTFVTWVNYFFLLYHRWRTDLYMCR
jgi:hypothetical protein